MNNKTTDIGNSMFFEAVFFEQRHSFLEYTLEIQRTCFNKTSTREKQAKQLSRDTVYSINQTRDGVWSLLDTRF